MTLAFSAADEAFRRELVAFIEAHRPADACATGDFIGTDIAESPFDHP